MDLCKNSKIICSRQGDILEAVLRNLDKNQYDVEKLVEECKTLMKRVLKRVRKYG